MTPVTQNAPKLMEHLEYRTFLAEWVAYQKRTRRAFSLRAFSTKIGLSSTSFLSAVIKGKKNLSDDVRHRLCAALGLTPDEETYFHLLVQFNQAKDMEGKNYLFKQLQKFRGSRARKVGEGQYRFYSKWTYAAVWNWLGMHPNERNPAKIASVLLPAVTPAQVEEAIEVLLELGLLRKMANGYQTCEAHLTTEPEVSSLAVKNHIVDLNRIAGELLDVVPASQRQYNTLMFQVSETGFQTIRERIRTFQEELRDILDRDQGEDRIYTLSMALFPHTNQSSTK